MLSKFRGLHRPKSPAKLFEKNEKSSRSAIFFIFQKAEKNQNEPESTSKAYYHNQQPTPKHKSQSKCQPKEQEREEREEREDVERPERSRSQDPPRCVDTLESY